ncbi:MAG TPA: 4-(cytidine 5'-diphospho)-2-C-methyl-D-erythritol kinase [Roseiarcus sp.]|nr:4-(cytidine 5'-diphospho)-2-C-methyl-D-erythritol kinase [Roseiarcus sp.]
MTARRALLAAETPRTWRAPAKVNLTLHILGRRDDGWHELDSVVAFAGCGDFLSFTPGPRLELSFDGPAAPALGPQHDNLVLRAARLLGERVPKLRVGRFHLRKFLPVAAGLGGGSADAAAALRALAKENGLSRDDQMVLAAARACGADTPVCLDPKARLMTGLGDQLGAPIRLPPLHAVLANPGVAVPTAEVFGRLGLAKGEATGAAPSPRLPAAPTRSQVFAALRGGRNDMEEAARALAPSIGEVLERLGAAKAAISRMSGSGATCFGLFESHDASLTAARVIAGARPHWWVKATVLR